MRILRFDLLLWYRAIYYLHLAFVIIRTDERGSTNDRPGPGVTTITRTARRFLKNHFIIIRVVCMCLIL